MSRRTSPINDAIHHVVSNTDKTYKLEVKYINATKGKVVYGLSVDSIYWYPPATFVHY